MRSSIVSVVAAAAALLVAQPRADAQTSQLPLIPHATWPCGMPDGIPSPDAGALVLEIEIALERVLDLKRTPYGHRRVAIGREGSARGPKLEARVTSGALDLELTLDNDVVEIEQVLVLEAADGSFVYARSAGTGPDADDVRVVMDFEAPSASEHAWLNEGRFVARRELNTAAKTLRLRVFDVTSLVARQGDGAGRSITKPEGVAPQPWGYRVKGASEQQGEPLITETVTLAPSQRVGASKRGDRNIIPITGGALTGRIKGKVLSGGADYQILTPPATIDAHYLWETDDGEIVIVRNGGLFGALVPTFETRVDGPYAYLNAGAYLSSNPSRVEGGVALSFYESVTGR